jgi:hypothetical protein
MKRCQCTISWSNLRAFAALGALALLAGCATTKPAPPYLVSPDGIGVAVASLPKAELATVPSAVRSETIGGALAAGKGAAFFGPLVLLLAPFTAAYGAAHGASCDQNLDAAYPSLSDKFSAIVQREFSLEDVQDQVVAVLQQHTSVPIVREEILYDSDKAAREQQPLAAAAQHARAHLFLVEIESISVSPMGNECDSWGVRVAMRIQLWSVADRKPVLYLAFGGDGSRLAVTGPLSEMRSIFDEPGALRSRLVPLFETTANALFYRPTFQLPP